LFADHLFVDGRILAPTTAANKIVRPF